jgi:hypothetical protein
MESSENSPNLWRVNVSFRPKREPVAYRQVPIGYLKGEFAE